jgi:mxaA protein
MMGRGLILSHVTGGVAATLIGAVLVCAVRPCHAETSDFGWARVPGADQPTARKGEHHLIPGWAAQPKQDARVKVYHLRAPRAYGLLTGDKVRQQVQVAVERAYHLQRSSLPASRWVTSWLELQGGRVEEARRDNLNRYLVTINYQIFATPRLVTLNVIPGFELRFASKNDSFTVKVPDWIFSISPLLEPEPLVENVWDIPVRADAPPPLIDTTRPAYALALFASLSVISGIYWLYLYSIWPFRRGSKAPFAQACRALGRLKHQADDEQALRDGFRTVHQAFNQTAGEVVFAEHLERFFAQRPSFGPLRTSIETFFDSSRRLFFGDRAAPHSAEVDLAWLELLCRQCRLAEQGIL